MPITLATITDRETVRSDLVKELLQRKADNPDYRVIDIGGRHNPWADEAVDAYVDVFEFETDKKLYVGDIQDEQTWRDVESAGPFDFAIISHVLEDIRYPMTALEWMPRIARAGFLGFPYRHSEFSNHNSGYWLGRSHHAWIFTVQRRDSAPVLRAIPKLPCVEYFNHARPAPSADDGDIYGPRDLRWLRRELMDRDNEFVVRWEGDLPWVTPDYSLDDTEQIALYRDGLAEAVEDPA
jgi:hypothetical protein